MRNSLAAALALLAFSPGVALADGELADFDSVVASGHVAANVEVGGAFSVEVLGADASLVGVRVEAGRLLIEAPSRRWFWGSARHINAYVNVSLPTLSRLEGADGAELTARGRCENLAVSAASGARIDTARMMCANGDVRATSGAHASVRFGEALDIDASRGADVEVFGRPRLGVTSISSGAVVEHR
jgi:hypothetical protein